MAATLWRLGTFYATNSNIAIVAEVTREERKSVDIVIVSTLSGPRFYALRDDKGTAPIFAPAFSAPRPHTVKISEACNVRRGVIRRRAVSEAFSEGPEAFRHEGRP